MKQIIIIIIILLRDVSLGTGDTIHQPGNSGIDSLYKKHKHTFKFLTIGCVNALHRSTAHLSAGRHQVELCHPPLVKRLDFQDSFDQLTGDILRPELPWHRRLLLAQNQCQLVTTGSAEAHSHSLTYPEHGYVSATLTSMQ